MRCRTRCELYADQGPYSPIIANLTNLTTLRVYDQMPNGWSRVHVEGGPLAGRVGLVRSENLVLVPENVITLPGPVIAQPSPPGTGPFVPGGPIDVDRPMTPSPVEPLPRPVEPETPPPAIENTPPIAETPAPTPTSWTTTAGQLLLLTSPLWGAVLLSKLLPR